MKKWQGSNTVEIQLPANVSPADVVVRLRMKPKR